MKNKITLFVLVSLLVISGSIINFQISAYDPVTYDNTITFTASLGSDGKVTTSWSKYNHSEAFTFYKLVRSSTVSNPVYPENSYIYFTTNADILTYTDTKAPAGTNYYRICHIASGKRYCSETVVTINKPSTTCTDSSWTPDTSTVCTGTNFTQTSNCNNTRQSTGTKSCNTCTDSSWTPDTSTVCSTETFTQISNCGNSRQSTGTKSCSTCSDISWSPDPSTVCSNTNFTQTSNCGNVRSVSGTKSCNTCTDSSWTPDTNTVCEGESLTQTSNCGNSRSISGTKVCTITNTGSTVEQNIFYVDPVNGSDSNNGSEASPWKTLDITKIQSEGPVSYPYRNSAPLKIINPNGPVKPGSTIYLKSGNYGTVNIYGYYNSDYITISAAPGSTPIFDQIRLYGGTKWKFNGLTIRGEKTANWQYLVYLLNHNWHGSISDIVFENANIYSVSSISGFTENDWNNKVANALQTNGSNVIIRNNKIKNINFGIITSGNNILVENNIVENYCGDGMRFGGNDNIFQYNIIKNNYKVNENHNDGIQAVLLPLNNTPIYRVTLRGNIIIGNEDLNQPFAGSVQGIGVFDNSVVDSLVENNLVIVNHWHGITLMGAVNTKIINNTVFNPYNFGESNYRASWISVIAAKNGTHGSNCIIRNNIVRQILSTNNDNVVIDHNLSDKFDPTKVFEDYKTLNLKLKQNSLAIDIGISSGAPNIDIVKISRPQGVAFDLGAYEYVSNESVINGTCGSDNNKTLSGVPINLCDTGTPSLISGLGPWSWSCIGQNGGINSSCKAIKSSNIKITGSYYIDYESGSDTNDGLSMISPWKHAPGDPNATGNPLSLILKPGDIIIFKAGVIYRGNIRIPTNGTETNPITYLGEGWGEGKAIIDGSQNFTGVWNRCESQNACNGNPNWANIYYTNSPTNYSFFRSLFEENKYLKYSQDPSQTSDIQFDSIREFRIVPRNDSSLIFNRTSLTDPRIFTQIDSNFYNNSYIAAWRTANWVTTVPIISFNPQTHTINYSNIGYNLYSDRDNRYSLLNHISFIDTPGEYSLTNGKIYAWLNNPKNIKINIAEKSYAFNVPRNNIIIDGFLMQNFYSETYTAGVVYVTGDNIKIKNNEIKNVTGHYSAAIYLMNTVTHGLVENNKIHYSRIRGIAFGGTNILVKNNNIENLTATAIYSGGGKNSQIINNFVDKIFTVHGNGISVYQGSNNILVANNIVKSPNILSFTYQHSGNIYVFQNLLYRYQNNYSIVQGTGQDSFGEIFFLNNVIGNDTKHNSLSIGDRGASNYLSINNIIDGGGNATYITRRNNIYTGLLWNQNKNYGWSLGESEIVENDLNKIFKDPINSDLNLKSDSIAINKGINVIPYLTNAIKLFPSFDFTKDFEGNVRPQGTIWDIGVYEYISNNNTDPNTDPNTNSLNGMCGLDNNKTIPNVPTNLCNAGKPSAITGIGPWYWSCIGQNGGVNVRCRAYKSTNCTDTTWTPDPNTICSPTSFTQTSNCNTTRQVNGTRNCIPSFSTGAIIANHTTTNLSIIPTQYIEQAKKILKLSYGHTSHGSQIVNGLSVIKGQSGSLYYYDSTFLKDTTPSGDLGNPDRISWADRTRAMLLAAGNDRNVVMWSWCGQVSTATERDINTYLNLMEQLEKDFPNVKFVYITGHLDGTGVNGNLNIRNEQIRKYVRDNNKILFDFADIESYDPSGNYYLDRGATDGTTYDNNTKNWSREWCAANPGNTLCRQVSCVHSEPLNCNLKARAFWWLMARLAGWNGN